MIIRHLREDEFPLLEQFLYTAVFQVVGAKPLPFDIIYKPELNVYISEFGRPDDYCLVAEKGEVVVGAVWSRVFRGGIKGYGFIDGSIPELAISVLDSFRGLGIGRQLMIEMLDLLKEEGYDKVSLSVQKANLATELYRSLGFKVIKETDEDYIMLYDFK